MFSPDGHWLAFVSDRSGRKEVYVRPYPGPGASVPVSTGGGVEPRWSRDGGQLFYRHGPELFAVTISARPDLELGPPRLLFEESGYVLSEDTSDNPNYDVGPDDRFLMVDARDPSGAPRRLVLTQNWSEELNQLVPVR